MNPPPLLIDENKIGCGKVDKNALTTFPQPLLLRRMFLKKGDISTLQKIGHFYFVLTRWAAVFGHDRFPDLLIATYKLLR